MRRVILGYSFGGAITALKINGASHEYHIIDGVKESVIDIMLNFKKLRFKVDENIERIQWISQRFK
jgi:DNA-directed RNA polymerase subunit alpha